MYLFVNEGIERCDEDHWDQAHHQKISNLRKKWLWWQLYDDCDRDYVIMWRFWSCEHCDHVMTIIWWSLLCADYHQNIVNGVGWVFSQPGCVQDVHLFSPLENEIIIPLFMVKILQTILPCSDVTLMLPFFILGFSWIFPWGFLKWWFLWSREEGETTKLARIYFWQEYFIWQNIGRFYH